MEKNELKNLIDAASGRIQSDLCIKNCKVVDVFNKEVFESDVYVYDGKFVGFGSRSVNFPEAKETFDAKGMYMAPGFIDCHVHIESSHVSPPEFSKLVVPCGTTTVVADPHEICNVCGLDGMDYMLDSSEGLPLSVFLQFPSCVPCTTFENAGAILKADAIASRIGHKRVLGLGELMDYPGVANADSDVLDKMVVALKAKKVIDGHAPDVAGEKLDAYAVGNILTDHECATGEELKDKIRRGMYVLLRQGTVCHDLLNLLKGVSVKNEERCLFCTDDCMAKTILENGHIDNNVRMAVNAGMDPITAICVATLNASNCYNLKDRGAIAPGRRADFVLFKDLKDIRPVEVYTEGNHVASHGEYLAGVKPFKTPEAVLGHMDVKGVSEKSFDLKLNSKKAHAIKVIPGSVVTGNSIVDVETDEKGNWKRTDQDVVKISVVERHHGTGNVGLALYEGFGLKGGAIATSVGHDSHNITVAGDSSRDMNAAVQELIRIGGGMAVAKEGKVLYSVPHEIAGLMADKPAREVSDELTEILQIARRELHIRDEVDPFMTLCFMSLPVIPELKITDCGLFDVVQFKFIPVEV
ncbi:MAG: adenine deaminase [Sphaerochaetaceae bacterium]|nr:adenine deaminase [Sphaerochaetaceae bacterium]